MRNSMRTGRLFASTAILVLLLGTFAMGQGIGLRAVSPVNESMGGAATGCPIDAAGAINWNPATISALPGSDISFSLGLILPYTSVESRVPTGMGPPAPAFVDGWTASEAGALPMPNMAFVRQIENSRWSYGVGVFTIGGMQVNYPCDPSNPILAPQPNGLGRLSAEVQIFQIQPVVSYEVNEHWSVGFGPTITMARLIANPLFLAPHYANGYSAGTGTRYAWGGGFQAGVYCTTDVGWHFGASIKSPQWTEPFRYFLQDASGNPVVSKFKMQYPLIASLGCSYSGFEDWTLACDIRYFDYANATGFSETGFNPATGAANGLGWNSVMSVGLGVQRRINDKISVRAGYYFNENPIPSASSSYNVASPLTVKHAVTVGASYALEQNWMASFAYTCALEESVSGPIITAAGEVPFSMVKSTASAHLFQAGISKRF